MCRTKHNIQITKFNIKNLKITKILNLKDKIKNYQVQKFKDIKYNLYNLKTRIQYGVSPHRMSKSWHVDHRIRISSSWRSIGESHVMRS
jgi:hypothetical protein